jgi:predicted RecB family nuclease
MIETGEELRRTTAGPLEIPVADIEIDVDIEWDAGGVVYLWGARIRQGQDDGTAAYVPFVSWEVLDEEGEERLAREFFDWLQGVLKRAGKKKQSLHVFHYSTPETSNLLRLIGEDECADALAHFVDLLGLMRQHFIGAHGLSIKKTAPAMGFEWRDEDPGGLQSQLWLQTARDGDGDEAEQARSRVLAYNEDDVTATAVLRDGLRSWPEG